MMETAPKVNILGRFEAETRIEPGAPEIQDMRAGFPSPWLIRAVHERGGSWLGVYERHGELYAQRFHFRMNGIRYQRLDSEYTYTGPGRLEPDPKRPVWKTIAVETWTGAAGYRPFHIGGHPMVWSWAEMVVAHLMGKAHADRDPLTLEEWIVEVRKGDALLSNYQSYLHRRRERLQCLS